MKKRQFQSIPLLVILCIGLLVVSQGSFGIVNASTDVQGIISSDTAWTKAGSPYVLTGPTAVAEGVKLTIEPGVTVDLGNFRLEINGTLQAKGAVNEKVTINAIFEMGANYLQKILFSDPCDDWNEQTQTGCIIENTILNGTTIWINNASIKIANNYLRGAEYNNLITVNGGSSIIIGNEMVFDGNGFDCKEGSPTFSDNSLRGYRTGQGWGIRARNITISNNTISNVHTAIIAYSEKPLTIKGNLISKVSCAIDSKACPAIITDNLIIDCYHGIVSGGLVTKNSIITYRVGLENPKGSSQIHYNNIISGNYSVYLSINENVDLSNNWWGTTDESIIKQSMYDSKFDYNLGTINFVPFLTSSVEVELVDDFIVTPTPSATELNTLEPSMTPGLIVEQGFLIESNSTVSAFAFNSTQPEISFTVTGPDNTKGYVKLTIAKAFMTNADTIKVYLDGKPVGYDLVSTEDSWILTFTYSHSSHKIIVNSTQNASAFLPDWVLISTFVAVIIALGLVSVVIVWGAKRKL